MEIFLIQLGMTREKDERVKIIEEAEVAVSHLRITDSL